MAKKIQEDPYTDWMSRDVQPLTFGNYMGAVEQDAASDIAARREQAQRLKMLQQSGVVPSGVVQGAQNAGMSPVTAGLLGIAGAGALTFAAYSVAKWRIKHEREHGDQ